MGYMLGIKYREKVEEFITSFIDNCEKCEDAGDMIQTAKQLLERLEQYCQKH